MFTDDPTGITVLGQIEMDSNNIRFADHIDKFETAQRLIEARIGRTAARGTHLENIRRAITKYQQGKGTPKEVHDLIYAKDKNEKSILDVVTQESLAGSLSSSTRQYVTARGLTTITDAEARDFLGVLGADEEKLRVAEAKLADFGGMEALTAADQAKADAAREDVVSLTARVNWARNRFSQHMAGQGAGGSPLNALIATEKYKLGKSPDAPITSEEQAQIIKNYFDGLVNAGATQEVLEIQVASLFGPDKNPQEVLRGMNISAQPKPWYDFDLMNQMRAEGATTTTTPVTPKPEDDDEWRQALKDAGVDLPVQTKEDIADLNRDRMAQEALDEPVGIDREAQARLAEYDRETEEMVSRATTDQQKNIIQKVRANKRKEIETPTFKTGDYQLNGKMVHVTKKGDYLTIEGEPATILASFGINKRRVRAHRERDASAYQKIVELFETGALVAQ